METAKVTATGVTGVPRGKYDPETGSEMVTLGDVAAARFSEEASRSRISEKVSCESVTAPKGVLSPHD